MRLSAGLRAVMAGLFLVGGLASCHGPRVTRAECLSIAERYRTHRWVASSANVLHGADADGVRVDTPDLAYQPEHTFAGWWTVGRENEGIPYQWGGFCTPEEFDAAVRSGKAAGDIYTEAKRALLEKAVSRHAAGIDCSGYVSRCWKLPRAHSTRELPKLCTRLASWNDLKPGDILNTHNAHCLLFAGWDGPARTRIIAYETGCRPTWKVFRNSIAVSWLKAQGYQPWRYRGMKD